MPSIKDTKRRIGSVKNTQKITKAMKLVSAAKFARANQAVLKAKAYGLAFEGMVKKVIQGTEVGSPLLEVRERKKVAVVVVGSDRGLCGGLNSNLIRKLEKWFASEENENIDLTLHLWGRRTFLLASEDRKVEKIEKVLEKVNYDFAAGKAKEFMTLFEAEAFDRVYIAYPSFVNAITQKPKVEVLLPIEVDSSTEEGEGSQSQYVFEPTKEELLDGLLHKNVTLKLFNILLNSSASEHAARMTAMDSATTNADEVIKSLTLQYNRARQAAITKELIEITSGAEAL